MTLYTVSWDTLARLAPTERRSVGRILAARIRHLRDRYVCLSEWSAVHPTAWGRVEIVAKEIQP